MKKIVLIANNKAGKGIAARIAMESPRISGDGPPSSFSPLLPDETREICWGLSSKDCQALFSLAVTGRSIRPFQPSPVGNCRYSPYPAEPPTTSRPNSESPSSWELIQTLLDGNRYESIDLIQVNGRPFATVGGPEWERCSLCNSTGSA